MTQMRFSPFNVPVYNQHYEGAYDQRMLDWRHAGAQDKADNIAAVLRANRATGIETVLEVGCGTGAVLLAVKERKLGTAHHGVDLADPNEHPHPGVAEANLVMSSYDGVKLPFADNSFDLVYASHVLEHVPDERGFLAEIKRVARRWVYIEVPCELNLRTSIGAMQTTLNIGHINAYTPESLALTLATSGLLPADIQLFDHSLAIHAFDGGKLKARAKMLMRRSVLKLNPTIASRVFTYHCGALSDVQAQPS